MQIELFTKGNFKYSLKEINNKLREKNVVLVLQLDDLGELSDAFIDSAENHPLIESN